MKFLIISVVSILVIIFIENKLKLIRNGTLIESFKNNYNLVNIICVSLCFASFMLIVSLVLEKLDIFVSSRGEFQVSNLSYILYTLSVVPVIEEYFYRFLPYRLVKNSQYFNIVAVISSLIFTFSHSVIGIEYAFIFLMALLLSYIFIKTKNVLYTMISHSIYNIFVFLNFYGVIDNIWLFIVVFFVSVIVLFRERIVNRLKNYT